MNRLHHMVARYRGFTLVELLIVIAVLAILAVLTIVAYNGFQHRATDSLVLHTTADAQKSLEAYGVFNHMTYPSNIAGTDYQPPLTVALALYTDASQTPVYQNLTPDQNAQLFLNACNGYMPVVSGATTYNYSCTYAGNNLHVKGTVASNVVIQGPTIQQADFRLICGSACDTAQTNIINIFLNQGGTFPVTVPSKGATLPAPTLKTTGIASNYCLEARSPSFTDIIYHETQSDTDPIAGPCPANASLHYP